jgi:hypothetical protein
MGNRGVKTGEEGSALFLPIQLPLIPAPAVTDLLFLPGLTSRRAKEVSIKYSCLLCDLKV